METTNNREGTMNALANVISGFDPGTIYSSPGVIPEECRMQSTEPE